MSGCDDLLIICDAGHESEVEDDEPTVRRAKHVTGMRIGVEKARVKQLCKIGDHTEVNQRAHVVLGALR